jgi:ribonuclease VapC
VFVDASAAVAIILNETDRDLLRRRLKSSLRRFMSPIADYETAMAVRQSKAISVVDAYEIVSQFQHIYAIKHLDIGLQHTRAALEAFERFGKGQGHKASLNMGDCFSYACAKIQRVPLLFKGNDFTHTDIQPA